MSHVFSCFSENEKCLSLNSLIFEDDDQSKRAHLKRNVERKDKITVFNATKGAEGEVVRLQGVKGEELAQQSCLMVWLYHVTPSLKQACNLLHPLYKAVSMSTDWIV